ncbi:MAG: hypothetical protein DI565_11980 [Ancylobacter novellus]|uniref:Uncharacterized protein n=1 Tax=Ancylobacter novellus TaxID=921 RepID=A0A2W5KFC6_ANCNO|nr:MAG: hypothetical protein DI565_11980 [Ancylobacter novellus]
MRGGGRDGFLLAEALSALALSALLMVALLAFTGLLRRSADRAAWRVETMEVSGRTVLTIASEIRQATRARWAPIERAPSAATPTPAAQGARASQTGGDDGGNLNRPAQSAGVQDPDAQQPQGQQQQPDRDFVFTGTPDRMIFALAPEQATGLRAPVMVVWQFDAAGATLRAEGPIRPEAKSAGDVPLGPVARIEPGPERLRFAYIDRDPAGTELIVDAWTDRRRMPVAVRIDRSDTASGVSLGSLRVPILLTGEPGCAAPDQGFCSRVDRQQAQGGSAAQPGRPAPGAPQGGERE